MKKRLFFKSMLNQLRIVFFMVALSVLLLLHSYGTAYGAGSISGIVSYGGSQTGTVYVGVLTSPLSCSPPNPGEPADYYIDMSSPGSYNLSGLSDGTYYVASVINTCGTDCDTLPTDPWGIYNGCSNITPVIISGGNVISNIDITLIDGTNENPNPFYLEENYYHLNISGNASGYIEFVRSPSEIRYTGFSVPGDGGGLYSGVEVILPFATHSPPLKFLSPQTGQTWTDTGESNGYQVDSFAEVISVSENVSVTAGTFNNCAKVDTNLSYPFGYTPGQRYPVKFESWFCPGIGPAKIIITEDDGTQYSGELTVYQNITADPNDYFPLGFGYTWTFMMNTGRSATWTVADDQDSDGIPDDGDNSGTAGDNPCTGGNTAGCDDNCIDTPNPDQADADNDGIGDVCDSISIAGTIFYSGVQTGNVYVGLYTSPVITPATRAVYLIALASPGIYEFIGIPGGTYYAGAIITQNPIDVEIDDPFGMYGIINPGDIPAPITIISNGNAVTGRDFTLFDGTAEQPNPFYSPWDLVAPMNVARDQFTCGVIDGKIYAFGGNGDPDGLNLKSTEMYDPSTGVWSFRADNEHNNGYGVEELSGAVVNGKFYVFGAWGGSIGVFNFVEEYDPSTDTWTSMAPKPTTVSGAPAAVYNGEIFLFGGSGGSPRTKYDVVEAYNPATNTWRTVTNMPGLSGNHAVAVIGDKAYVIGGHDPLQDILLSDVIVYDFLTDQWITTGFEPLSTPRAFIYAGAAPVIDGKIYLIGGGEIDQTGFRILDIVEIYDTLTNTWSTGDSLPQITDDFCSVVLDRSIYMLSGVIEYGESDDVRTDAVWMLDLSDSENCHSYDTDQDWVIGDFELLDAIDAWAESNLGDFDLLDLIDYWAFGSYCWDVATDGYKAGAYDEYGVCQ